MKLAKLLEDYIIRYEGIQDIAREWASKYTAVYLLIRLEEAFCFLGKLDIFDDALIELLKHKGYEVKKS